MGRGTAVAVLLVGTAVSITTAARRLRRGGREHPHHCFLCDGIWTHLAQCTEGPARLCPWCLAGSRTDGAALPEFERAIKLEEGVLRFLVVVNEGAQPVPVTAGKSDEEDDE